MRIPGNYRIVAAVVAVGALVGVLLAACTSQCQTDAISHNNSATFISFLTMPDKHLDPGLTIHLVLDNGSSHTSKATRKWLAARPRFRTRYTPKHASWLDQNERTLLDGEGGRYTIPRCSA